MNFDINDFIKPENPVCREERQYSALLYTVFLRVLNKTNSCATSEEQRIVKNVIGDYTNLKQVFFEATLMRDYFFNLSDEEKIEFNTALLSHCGIDANSISIIKDSLGSPSADWRKIQDAIKDKDTYFNIQYARYMMRAKPDLLVVYERGNELCVKIIECKYTQKEGKYKDKNGHLTVKQEDVQEQILKFLFGEKGVIKSEDKPFSSYEVIEVDFDKKGDNSAENVSIKELINIAYKR